MNLASRNKQGDRENGWNGATKIILLIRATSIICWLSLSAISLNHLWPVIKNQPSSRLLGAMGWVTFVITLFYLSRKHVAQSIFIIFIFILIGIYLGPYLEPPADTLDHLKRTYSCVSSNSLNIPKINRGYWHYCMSSSFLFFPSFPVNPESILGKIFLLHGLYLALAMNVIFVLSKMAGLPDRWAFLSVIAAFLFMGTNRFSYFTYYSLAPTFTSIIIFWFWTAAFFFKRNIKSIITGLAFAVISLPILMVNHIQEIYFIMLVVSIWLVLNIHSYVWPNLKYFWGKSVYLFILFFIFFVIPQFDIFQRLATACTIKSYWNNNQAAIVYLGGIQLFGKIWTLRVSNTLGIMGIIPVGLLLLRFWPRIIKGNSEREIRIYVLGILPFIGYCIPLYHTIWIVNCKLAIYYRLCYSSMFWLSIAYALFKIEGRFKETCMPRIRRH